MCVNENFAEYISILHDMKELEDIGNEVIQLSLDSLKEFLIDHRICAPDAVISISKDTIDIKSSERYSASRIVEIENFTGFVMTFADNGHYIFKYEE